METDSFFPVDDPLEVIGIIKESLGDAFSIEELLWVIESVFVLNRIAIQRVILPPDKTGRIFKLRDAVVIQINNKLDRDHAQCVFCHELGHVIFNHVCETAIGYDDFMGLFHAGRIEDLAVAYRDHSNIFDDPQERAAEDLALLLIECIERWEKSLPEIAHDIFGTE